MKLAFVESLWLVETRDLFIVWLRWEGFSDFMLPRDGVRWRFAFRLFLLPIVRLRLGGASVLVFSLREGGFGG